MKIVKCARCGRDRQHFCKGMCRSCYMITWQKGAKAKLKQEDKADNKPPISGIPEIQPTINDMKGFI